MRIEGSAHLRSHHRTKEAATITLLDRLRARVPRAEAGTSQSSVHDAVHDACNNRSCRFDAITRIPVSPPPCAYRMHPAYRWKQHSSAQRNITN